MPFSVAKATPEDLPAMVDTWYSAFTTPGPRRAFPNTPAVRKWLSDAMEVDMTDPSRSTIYMIVTEDPEPLSSERPKPVAYAAYRRGIFEKDWHARWSPPIVEGMSEEILGPGFFDPMMRQHIEAMGERPHYFLEVLCTHTGYQKKGLGSMLLQWGSEEADREGLEMYLDSAKPAQGLYEKYGYVEQECRDEKAASTPMRREAKK